MNKKMKKFYKEEYIKNTRLNGYDSPIGTRKNNQPNYSESVLLEWGISLEEYKSLPLHSRINIRGLV